MPSAPAPEVLPAPNVLFPAHQVAAEQVRLLDVAEASMSVASAPVVASQQEQTAVQASTSDIEANTEETDAAVYLTLQVAGKTWKLFSLPARVVADATVKGGGGLLLFFGTVHKGAQMLSEHDADPHGDALPNNERVLGQMGCLVFLLAAALMLLASIKVPVVRCTD